MCSPRGEQHDAGESQALFAHLAAEEDDVSLKAYRALPPN